VDTTRSHRKKGETPAKAMWRQKCGQWAAVMANERWRRQHIERTRCGLVECGLCCAGSEKSYVKSVNWRPRKTYNPDC